MNNDISRCGFRNLRMFVIIVLTRNTPDYFARERLYCSTFCSSLVSFLFADILPGLQRYLQ